MCRHCRKAALDYSGDFYHELWMESGGLVSAEVLAGLSFQELTGLADLDYVFGILRRLRM